MRRIFLFCTLAAMLLAMRPALAQGVLPPAVSSWSSREAKVGIPSAEAATLREYGMKTAERRTYSHAGNLLTVSAYTFNDPSGAYGAYSFLRTPDMAQTDLTKHSSMSRNHALALTGNILVEIEGQNLERFHGELEMLVAQAGGHAQFGSYPPLPQQLPPENFVPRSDHYLMGPLALNHFLPLGSGDWAGFSMGAEAELAHYRLQNHDATLLVLDYPTPQIAASEMKKLSSELNIAGSAGTAAKRAPLVYARRDGMEIALLEGAPSATAADNFLKQMRTGMAVIWDAPIFHKPHEPSMGTMIVGTIVGTGEICGFALLGGLAFAGIRLAIKRYWPGQVFDRPEDLEIIQLGLSSKPIKTKDLY